MSQKINFIQARVDIRALQSDIKNLNIANMDKVYAVDAVKGHFNCCDDGRTMTVDLPWLGVVAKAQARPVWGGGDWRMEYAFMVPCELDDVEVFRFFIDDDLMASSVDEELWGSATASHAFIVWVCESVATGLLNSAVFAPKA